MKILFITSNRLGDAVLSTGILSHLIKIHPNSEITIACGALGGSLFYSAPNVKKVIVLHKKTYARHWIYLWKKCLSTHWDIIVDIRNSAVSRLLLGNKKFIWQGIDKKLHKVEQMGNLLKLDTIPAPKLWFSEEQQNTAKKYIPNNKGKVLAIGPATNWIGKTWEVEKFIELIKRLTKEDGILPNAPVAIFAAPNEEEIAYKVLNSIPKNRQIDVIAKLDPATSATVLSRTALYIGNDSGLMHCAAASNVPTIGLFGPGYPAQYRPWGKNGVYVSTPETADEIFTRIKKTASEVNETLMTTLTVEAVEKTAQKHWSKCTV